MRKLFFSCLMLAASLCPSVAQQAETLGRGLVAVKTKAGVYLSWRCLTSDKSSQGYDVYRDGVKVNAEPITGSTNYVDASGTADAKYVVKAVDGGQVVETTPEAAVWPEVYKRCTLTDLQAAPLPTAWPTHTAPTTALWATLTATESMR